MGGCCGARRTVTLACVLGVESLEKESTLMNSHGLDYESRFYDEMWCNSYSRAMRVESLIIR